MAIGISGEQSKYKRSRIALYRANTTPSERIRPLIVDLHTHTTASDGGLTPQALVERAIERGVDMLAITDHDTLDAYQQLGTELRNAIHLVVGAEFSCNWQGVNIHILGLNLDPTQTSMITAIDVQKRAREQRGEEIDRRLAKKGISGALAAIRETVKDRPIGRPDFARYMVEQGHASSMNDAFDRYLGAGKIGDVKAMWPGLPEIVAAIHQAGGVAVIAHPMHYKMTNAKLRRLIVEFCELGGDGLEVANGRPPEVELRYLRDLCNHYGLKASVGSDFHNLTTWSDLGCAADLVGNCSPIWQHWQ